ncbi:MAG: hypothetical protein H0X71_09260 [Rubrobacter sp.]|nr:hypothetical protein [Rubrobacter sp.]
MTIEELQRQFRKLKDDKDFDVTLKQRLAYLMSAAERAFVVENLGMEIQRDVEPVRFGEPGKGFHEKGGFQRGQGMVGAV